MPVRILDLHHLVVIAVGYAGGLAAFRWLPGPYLELGESLAIRAAIAFLIPTAALVSCSAADMLFRRSGEANIPSAKAIRSVVLCAALFMVALHGLILASLLGFPMSQFSPHRLVVILTGLFLVGIPVLLSMAVLIGVTVNVAAYWRWTRG